MNQLCLLSMDKVLNRIQNLAWVVYFDPVLLPYQIKLISSSACDGEFVSIQ